MSAYPTRRAWLLLALLSACGGSSDDYDPPQFPPPPPPPPAPTAESAPLPEPYTQATPNVPTSPPPLPPQASAAAASPPPLPVAPSTPAQPADGQQLVYSYPSGQWVYMAGQGWVWIPAGASTTYWEGTPYVYLYTPAYGWTWYVSPWGPGPYHYGLWIRHPWHPVGLHGYWVAHPNVVVRLGHGRR
jgi:hypothetical protein